MPDWLATAMLVVARVAAMILIVPGISQRIVPLRARLLILAALVGPVLCVIPPAPHGQLELSSLPALLVHEFVVGLSLGLVPAAMVWGLQLAVQTLQGMTGLPGAGQGDGQGASDPPLQRLFLMLVLVIFFVSSGHRCVLQATLDSFRWLPPGSFTSLDAVHPMLIEMLSASFALGVRAISPIAASLAVSLMTLAAINRVIPQFGYFSVGMSVQTSVLFGSLILCLGAVVWLLENSFAGSADAVVLAWQDLLSRLEFR